MRILPVQYQYANTQQYCYKSTTKPNQILSTKKQIYSQNISFGGLFDIFKKKEKVFYNEKEAARVLEDCDISKYWQQRVLLCLAQKGYFDDGQYYKSIVDTFPKLKQDGFELDKIFQDNCSRSFTPESFEEYTKKLYMVKDLGYPYKFMDCVIKSNLPVKDLKNLIDVRNEGYKQRELLDYASYSFSDDELDELFFENPNRTVNTMKILGKKDFIHTFAQKYDNVENNIDCIGAINTKHPLYESLLELTNPTESAKYLKNQAKIKDLKSKFNEVEDKNELIQKINELTDKNKNLVSQSIKDPVDKVKLAHIFAALKYDKSPKLRYILKNCNLKTRDGQNKFNKLINNPIRQDENGRICYQLNFKNSKYLLNLYMADSDFMANYKVLLSNINKYAQNRTIAQMFDSMPMNENTKSQFKKLGLNYNVWAHFNPNSKIQKEVILKNENLAQSVIDNIEQDLTSDYFNDSIPAQMTVLKNIMAENGFELRKQNVANYDEVGEFDGTKTVVKLFKNGEHIKFEDLSLLIKIISEVINTEKSWTAKDSESVEIAKNTLKNHLASRKNEMRSIAKDIDDKPMQMTVRKVDMNNVEYALFLGNHASCCTAVGTGVNQWTAPIYVSCKMISAIEVLDGDVPIGNTMCFIAKIDGKPALVLDNIELKARYQYNDEIRDSIIDYAQKLAKELGQPNMAIYAGANRHKVNFENFPLDVETFKIVGSSGNAQMYFDFDTDAYDINGKDVFEAELYRIR